MFMKLKLTQRIAINYYKAKIKAISILSRKKAAEKAFEIFCTPFSGKPKRKEPPIFHHAEKIFCTVENKKLTGWQWIPKNNNGKKILIAHGFDSCSYKFDNYIQPLTQQGYTVIAFDAPAHGLSEGKTINALQYKNAIIEIDKQFGNIYCIIAHSLGALAASLAAEKMPLLQKIIFIAPATETQRAIDNFFKFVPLGNEVKADIEQLITSFENKPLSYYSVSSSIKQIHIPVLWVHDTKDWICPIEDVKPVQELNLSNVQFYFTEGYGHNKIYRTEKVMNVVEEFINH